jgi:hypothetical protein
MEENLRALLRYEKELIVWRKRLPFCVEIQKNSLVIAFNRFVVVLLIFKK